MEAMTDVEKRLAIIEKRMDEANNLINELYKEEKQLKNVLREEADKARELLVPEYSFQIIVTTQEHESYFDPPVGTTMLRVIGTLANGHIFDAHIKRYKSLSNTPSDQIGMTYYRVGNCLISSGGGTYVLKSPAVIEDEEWTAMIEDGIIPKRLLQFKESE